MFYVETALDCIEFHSYRDAEIYCGEHNISCRNIYQDVSALTEEKVFSILCNDDEETLKEYYKIPEFNALVDELAEKAFYK